MKKLLLTLSVVFLFAIYSVFQKRSAVVSDVVSQPTTTTTTLNPTVSSARNIDGVTNTPVPTGMQMKTVGKYRDGIYTGPLVDAFYGNVQVQVTVSGGRISNVEFLQYPNDRRQSVYINSQAMPYLKQEAILAQSAGVNIVSGATATSRAYISSLSSALNQAIN